MCNLFHSLFPVSSQNVLVQFLELALANATSKECDVPDCCPVNISVEQLSSIPVKAESMDMGSIETCYLQGSDASVNIPKFSSLYEGCIAGNAGNSLITIIATLKYRNLFIVLSNY